MTRVKISLAIILILIGGSIFSGVWTNSRCENMIQMLDETVQCVIDGDAEGAKAKAREFSSVWDSFRKKASTLVRSDRLSEADRIKSRIIHLIENGSDEIEADLDELRNILRLLREGELPYFTSVF